MFVGCSPLELSIKSMWYWNSISKNFLGKIPIHQDLREATDKGDPLTHSDPAHEVSKIFKDIAEKIKLAFQ